MGAEHEQGPLSLIVFEFNQGGRLRTESLGPALGRQLIDQTMWVRRDSEQDILQVQKRRDVDEFAAASHLQELPPGFHLC
jgi:hypothetical protein